MLGKNTHTFPSGKKKQKKNFKVIFIFVNKMLLFPYFPFSEFSSRLISFVDNILDFSFSSHVWTELYKNGFYQRIQYKTVFSVNAIYNIIEGSGKTFKQYQKGHIRQLSATALRLSWKIAFILRTDDWNKNIGTRCSPFPSPPPRKILLTYQKQKTFILIFWIWSFIKQDFFFINSHQKSEFWTLNPMKIFLIK